MSDHYISHIIHVKGTTTDRFSETVFFKHKYLTNPTVTHVDTVVDAARALCKAPSKQKQGTSIGTMDTLRNLSNIFLATAKSNTDKSWEELAKQVQEQPLAVHQTQTHLSRLAASILRPERVPQLREPVTSE